MDNELRYNIFTYGTLRRGECNNGLLDVLRAEFLSTGQIRGEVLTANSGLPFLMEGLGLVDGDIYAVDGHALRFLDEFEGHPAWYERREVTTESGLKVWVYFGMGIQADRQA